MAFFLYIFWLGDNMRYINKIKRNNYRSFAKAWLLKS